MAAVSKLDEATHKSAADVAAALAPITAAMQRAKDLQDALEQRKSLQADVLQQAVQKYSISFDAAGAGYQTGNLADRSEDLIQARDALLQSGMSQTAVLTAMAGDFSKLAQDAKQTGIDLPTQLKDSIGQLADMRLLKDEHGNDINAAALTFSDELKPLMDNELTKLDAIIAQLQDANASLKAIGQPTTPTVPDGAPTKTITASTSIRRRTGSGTATTRAAYRTRAFGALRRSPRPRRSPDHRADRGRDSEPAGDVGDRRGRSHRHLERGREPRRRRYARARDGRHPRRLRRSQGRPRLCPQSGVRRCAHNRGPARPERAALGPHGADEDTVTELWLLVALHTANGAAANLAARRRWPHDRESGGLMLASQRMKTLDVPEDLCFTPGQRVTIRALSRIALREANEIRLRKGLEQIGFEGMRRAIETHGAQAFRDAMAANPAAGTTTRRSSRAASSNGSRRGRRRCDSRRSRPGSPRKIVKHTHTRKDQP